MTDFYKILGLEENASNEEIKKAYRKLSLKFHPDKNNGDLFFTERFREIQEAYDTLIDSEKRNVFDNQLLKDKTSKTNQGFNFDPIIEAFEASDEEFEYNEDITFSWKSINADKVILKPFGIVQPIGQKTYKIKDFKNSSISFELIAENTNTGRRTKKTIKLGNRTYKELYRHFKQIIENELITKRKGFQYKTVDKNDYHFVTIETNKGVLELEPYDIIIGTKAYLNKKPAPDGKYKIDWFTSLVIKDGKVVR